MSERLIAIGDIHGCADALATIITAIDPRDTDTIVALGDYVDRGPNSRGVIDQLIALREKCQLVALRGNHEEMMLDVVRNQKPHQEWLQHGGVQTLDSYGFVGDMNVVPDDHQAFFDSMVDYYESENHVFVHANYEADKPFDELDAYTMRWKKLSQQIPGPHMSGKRVVVGHTHDRGGEIHDQGHVICLDTYCYGGFWLTAMDMLSGQVWQTSPDGKLRSDR